jgi:hypothetical protein
MGRFLLPVLFLLAAAVGWWRRWGSPAVVSA